MQVTETIIPARTVATFTDLMTGETVENAELTPVTITIDGNASETLYFAPDSLAAIRALADEDGDKFREIFAPVKRSGGAARASGKTDTLYPGTNQVMSVVRGWARENGGITKAGNAVAASAKFTLNDETFAKMITANPAWSATAVSADAKTDPKPGAAAARK